MLNLRLPCRCAGARRLPAARARTRRWHRCGAGVGLLLLLPVIGLACAAPPWLSFSARRCSWRCYCAVCPWMSLEIPLLQWQARSMATEHVVLKSIALLPLSGRMAEVRCAVGYFYVSGTNNHYEAFSESIYILVWTRHFVPDAGSAVACCGVITLVVHALATGGAFRAFCLYTYGIMPVELQAHAWIAYSPAIQRHWDISFLEKSTVSLDLYRICLLQLRLQDEDTATDTFLNGFLVLLSNSFHTGFIFIRKVCKSKVTSLVHVERIPNPIWVVSRRQHERNFDMILICSET